MPIEALVDHPLAMTLPAAGFGILFRLLMHFWLSECRELPKSDRELRSIGRAHVPVWKAYKADIFECFEAIKPSMVAYLHERVTKANGLRIAARAGQAARKARSVATHIAEASPATEMLTSPQREANAVARPAGRAKTKRVESQRDEALAAARMTDRIAA